MSDQEDAELLQSLNITTDDLFRIAADYLTDMNLMKTAKRLGLPYLAVWKACSTSAFELALQTVKDSCDDEGIKKVITKSRLAFKLWEIANDEIEARVSERKGALDSLTKLLGYDPSSKLDVNVSADPKMELILTTGDQPLEISEFIEGEVEEEK